jgi:hypothetical protein
MEQSYKPLLLLILLWNLDFVVWCFLITWASRKAPPPPVTVTVTVTEAVSKFVSRLQVTVQL